jgi:hypothetical protein
VAAPLTTRPENAEVPGPVQGSVRAKTKSPSQTCDGLAATTPCGAFIRGRGCRGCAWEEPSQLIPGAVLSRAAIRHDRDELAGRQFDDVPTPTDAFGLMHPTGTTQLRRLAERASFQDLCISDHNHPWNDAEGQSPLVWTVIGALAEAVPSMRVTTADTCPTIRIHPAVIAQAAATAAVLLNGRFAFGVDSGEALNEHILGKWPPAPYAWRCPRRRSD